MAGADSELQRLRPAGRRAGRPGQARQARARDGLHAEHGRLRRQRLHVQLAPLVARLEEDRGVPPPARLRAAGALRRVVAAPIRCSRSTRRSSIASPATSWISITRSSSTSRRSSRCRRHRAVPESVRELAARVARRQPRRDVRVQPARPSALSRRRDRRRDRDDARTVIEETQKTFVEYSGKRYREDVADGKEIIWASERDGWNHLYLYDGATGQVKNQITKGQWVVRGVDSVDEKKRQIWFRASGMHAGQGPVLHPLLPHQLRRHGPDARSPSDDGTHTRDVSRRPRSTTSTPGRASICRRSRCSSARAISRSCWSWRRPT